MIVLYLFTLWYYQMRRVSRVTLRSASTTSRQWRSSGNSRRTMAAIQFRVSRLLPLIKDFFLQLQYWQDETVGAESRHDMRPSFQLTSVSGVDSKLGNRTTVRPSLQSAPETRSAWSATCEYICITFRAIVSDGLPLSGGRQKVRQMY